MKKVSVLAAVALLAGAALVSAEGFKLNGYIRAGWLNEIDALDTGNDRDGETAESSTSTWLAGDYFGGSTRSRLNFSWSNKDETAGAFVRLQYTGAAEDWDLAKSTPYAYAWVKPFDGKLIVAAGKMADDWITSDGYEGFSVLDGKSGFFAGISPVEGLVIGGGALVDYLDKWPLATEEHERASRKAGYVGAKYSTDMFTIDAGFAFAGEFYANANITPVDGLLLAFEYKYDADDILDDGNQYVVGNDKVGEEAAEHTFVEQVEYTGIENLLVGVESYQYINDHRITWDDSSVIVTVTPYVRYDFNDIFAASVEATIRFADFDDGAEECPDTFATIVPAVYLKVADGAEAHVFGKISTDTDQEKHQIGTGVIFRF